MSIEEDKNKLSAEASNIVHQSGFHPYIVTVMDALRAVEEGVPLVFFDDLGNEHNIPADLIVEAWEEFCTKFEGYIVGQD